MRIFILLTLLGFTLNAMAWSERGNGGNSILCENPADNKFYDAYEAEYRYGLKPIFPKIGQACHDDSSCLDQSIAIARNFIGRLPDTNHSLKKFLLEKLNKFKAEINLLDGIELFPVNDMGIGFIPKGCELNQTFIQKRPIFPKDKRYIISNDVWKLLSPHQKAVGIVHELLYYYSVSLSRIPDSSEKIRYLNALIISGEITSYTSIEYLNVCYLVFE
ncbi:MAG: hypothetical protein NDI69_03330 [Bacteriovoracaceae bacterium]|nr:hypothetical protein [Bacteriovoracaceae bacterium]